jgi:hypothetical protein
MQRIQLGGSHCEAIMDKINAKLEGKVSDYALKVVPKDTETKLRVVGVCEGGSKKIIYQKQKAASLLFIYSCFTQ